MTDVRCEVRQCVVVAGSTGRASRGGRSVFIAATRSPALEEVNLCRGPRAARHGAVSEAGEERQTPRTPHQRQRDTSPTLRLAVLVLMP
jgi:hypothetical protein